MTNSTSNGNAEKIFLRWAVGVMVAIISMGIGHVTTKDTMHQEFVKELRSYVPRSELEAQFTAMTRQLDRIEDKLDGSDK